MLGYLTVYAQGWVTDLYYWQDAKLLVSASNEGLLITWGTSSIPHQVKTSSFFTYFVPII